MPVQQDLTLATLFKAVEDGSFKNVVGKLTTLLNGLNTATQRVNATSSNLQKASKQATTALSRQASAAKTATQATNKFGDSVDKMANSLRTAARYFVAYRLFHGITQGAREGFSEIVNFDQALQNLAAISGATSAEIEIMKDALIETADRTKYSTTEIAEGMVLLTQAGLSAAEATSAIGAVADLAAGTLSSLADTSDLVTTSLRAFNIDASETRRVADVMANAVNKSKLTIDKLRTAFNYVGAGAAQAGLSIEQTAASMMMLANSGARASTIGTGLRQVIARILSPNRKLRDAMAAYGLELDKANGSQEWFGDQVDKLASIMYDFETNTVDMSKAYELFGLRGAQAAAVLVSNYLDLNGVWDQTYKNAMAVGTANKMMGVQAEGLAFKIKNLGDKLRNLSIVVGDAGLKGALAGVVDLLRGIVKLFVLFASTVGGQVVVNTLTFTTAIIGATWAIKVLMGLLTKLKVMTFLASPAFWGVAAIGAAIAVVIALARAQTMYITKLSKTIETNKALVGSFSNYKEQLEKVTEGSDEYYRIVELLKTEHPKYAKAIDKVKDSYKELKETLDEITRTEIDRQMRDVTNSISRQMRSVQNLTVLYEQYSKMYGESAKSMGEWMEEFNLNLDEGYRTVKLAISAYTEFSRELYKKEGWDAAKKSLESYFSKYANYTAKTKSAYDAILEVVKSNLDQQAMFEQQAADRREKALNAHAKKLKEAIPAAWKGVYKNLSMLEQLRFLDTLRKTNEEWSKKKETAEKMLRGEYKTEEAFQRKLAVMKKELYNKNLSDFIKTNEKMRNLITSFPADWKAIFEKLNDEEKLRFIESYNTAVNGWKKHLKVAQEYIRNEKLSAEEGAKFIANTKKQYMDRELSEFIKKEDAIAYKAEQILQEINEKYERYSGDRYDTEAAKAESFYKQQEQKIDQLASSEREKDLIRLKNKEAYYIRLERLARMHGIETPEEKRKFKALTGKEVDATFGITSVDKLSELWRTVGGNLADYRAQLDALKAEGKISLEDHEKALNRTFATPGKAMASGWGAAMKKVRSSSEFLYDLGEALPDKIADGFVDVWDSWMDGTKSASEAFADFARGVLKWIAQMIVKQLALNALQGITNKIGIGGATTALVKHKGGMVAAGGPTRRVSDALFNFAPRLHDGINNKLKTNEYPAILEQGEAVFTKEQMKNLDRKGGTTINVPVSITDSEYNDAMKKHLPAAVEQAVLRTMRKVMR